MSIAIAANDMDGEATVPALFADAAFLIIVDEESGEVREWVKRGPGGDTELARAVLDWDCESVVCGPIEREPFDILAIEGCVTRYNGAGLSIQEALERYVDYGLGYITDCIGGSGCESVNIPPDLTSCTNEHDELGHSEK